MKNTYDNNGRFTSVEEQINKLGEYGIKISNKEFAGNVLKCISYYYLIDVYSEIFKIDGERRKFISYTTFEELYYGYMFDVDLKLFIISFLKPIEQHIKTLIAYYFAKAFSHRSSEYLSPGKYFDPTIVEMLETKINEDYYLRNYYAVNENAPMWVIVNRLTFGETSQLFSALKREMQNQICAEFRTFTTAEFEEMLALLVEFRNICSHDDPLYCFISKTNIAKQQCIERIVGDLCNFYGLLKIISYLIDDNELNRLVWGLNNRLKTLKPQISPTAYNNLTVKMGLNENWNDILREKKEALNNYYDNIKIDTHLGTIKAIDIPNDILA